MKKIISLLITLFILGGTTAVCDELGALKVYNTRLPIYNSKGRLQYMIFCAVMTRKTDKIYADDAIIDLVKNNVDVNKIKYLEDIKPYKLGTSPADVAEFWKDKTNSLGFISSSKAIILQDSKIVSGSKKVFFRSPQLDLNGIGFTADFDKRIIQVFQDIDIIVRMNSGEGKKISKGDIVKVKADSMIMDMEKKLITLIGNVKVDDAGFDIFCSRLIIDLNKDENDDKEESDDIINPNGVSSIICLGKVKIIRKISAEELKKNGAQKAFADKAVYNTSNEQITLTGKNPQIHHGDNMISGQKIIIWKNSERLQAFKNCLVETIDKKAAKPKKTVLTSNFIDFDYANNIGIFTGHVRVKNAEFKLNCNKMDVHLQTRGKKKDADSGGKEIKKIICTGTVIVNDPRAQVNCDRMVVTFKDSVPGGKKSKVDIDGGGKREVDLIKCFGNVHMLNKPENIEEKPTIISSNDAVLNIPDNVADLLGNVKIEESRFYLTCEKMKLIAKEITPEKAAANAAANQETYSTTPKHIGIGDSRELIKIICLGKVVMTRKLSYETQKACGDKGVYIINDHQITLTSEKGKPTLQRGPTVMEGSKIILWTDSEQLDVEEGTLKGFVGD